MSRGRNKTLENVPFMVIVSPHNVHYTAGKRFKALDGVHVVVSIQSIKSRQDGRLEIIGQSRPVKPKGEKRHGG